MRSGVYEGEAYIYSHKEVIELIRSMSKALIRGKDVALLDDRLHLVEVEDGQTMEIIGHEVSFFDIGSTKAKQFGFSMKLNESENLPCCGDEPYAECAYEYAVRSKWLLHEAFCLYEQADIFKPYILLNRLELVHIFLLKS